MDTVEINWSDLVGHKAQAEELRTLWQEGRLPHALLFTGAAGIGKKLCGQILAKMILCGQEEAPCGQCENCRSFAAAAHPDYYELIPEVRGKSTRIIRIEAIREMQTVVSRSAIRAGQRVVLIDDADTMNEAAANSRYYEGSTTATDPYQGKWDYPYTGGEFIYTQGSYKPAPEDFLNPGIRTDQYGNVDEVAGADWQDEIFRTGFQHDYSLNVSGGSDKGWFSYGGNYSKQTGIIKNTGNERYGLSMNIGRHITNDALGDDHQVGQIHGVHVGLERFVIHGEGNAGFERLADALIGAGALEHDVHIVAQGDHAIPFGHGVGVEGIVREGLIHLVENHVARIVIRRVRHSEPDLVTGEGEDRRKELGHGIEDQI